MKKNNSPFKRKKICMVVGARPNFMKMSPLYKILTNAIGTKHSNRNQILYDIKVINTRQHHDKEMSDFFINLFRIECTCPKFTLSSDLNDQVCQIVNFVKVELYNYKPSLVILFGDVRSSFAAAIAAYNLNIPIAHVESGLRCFINDMPEEINRRIIDIYSKYHFTTEKCAMDNLINEKIVKVDNIDKTCFNVGNTMIDTLIEFKQLFIESPFILSLKFPDSSCPRFNEYILVTIHRQSNLNEYQNLKVIIYTLIKLSNKYKIIFPVHPRTKIIISDSFRGCDNILLINPVGYLEFMSMMYNSAILLCDSAGQSEESSYLGIHCITLRLETERPITCEQGTNILISKFETEHIINLVDEYYGKRIYNVNIDLWDGCASNRISQHIENILF